jgi:hypothetical protein
VQVGQVKDDSVRQVVEADIVVVESPASVDHLDVVQLLLFHGLEYRDLFLDPLQVEFGRLIGIHAMKLGEVSIFAVQVS